MSAHKSNTPLQAAGYVTLAAAANMPSQSAIGFQQVTWPVARGNQHHILTLLRLYFFHAFSPRIPICATARKSGRPYQKNSTYLGRYVGPRSTVSHMRKIGKNGYSNSYRLLFNSHANRKAYSQNIAPGENSQETTGIFSFQTSSESLRYTSSSQGILLS